MNDSQVGLSHHWLQKLGDGFKYVFIFTPTWGNDPIWLIFFKGVETTNQKTILTKGCEPVFWQGPMFFFSYPEFVDLSYHFVSLSDHSHLYWNDLSLGKDFMTTLPSTNIAPENRPSQK